MRKFKTAEDNRTNYIYYFNDGTSYTITPGDRIAQLVLVPIIQAQLDITDSFTQSERADGGFGHTGQQ